MSTIKVDTIATRTGSGNITVSNALSGSNIISTANITDANITTAKIADNAITTAKITDANITQPKIAKSMQGWELIENKVSATAGDLNQSTGNIEFQNCFSTNYLYYKLVIGYFSPAATNNNTINFQWLYSTNTYITAAGYHWVVDRLRSDSTSLDRTTSSGNTHVRLWSQIYSHLAGGIHGEINFWNHHAPVLGGTNTDRGSNYRPWVQSDLVGYEPSDDCFTRTFAHGRYDVSNPDTFMTGFVISTASGNCMAGTHMSLFGYRNPV